MVQTLGMKRPSTNRSFLDDSSHRNASQSDSAKLTWTIFVCPPGYPPWYPWPPRIEDWWTCHMSLSDGKLQWVWLIINFPDVSVCSNPWYSNVNHSHTGGKCVILQFFLALHLSPPCICGCWSPIGIPNSVAIAPSLIHGDFQDQSWSFGRSDPLKMA